MKVRDPQEEGRNITSSTTQLGKEANLFFNLVSELYERACIIVTSNKGFHEWAEMMRDEVMTTAMLDEIAQLSSEDQEMVGQIVHKRIIEEKREEIYIDYEEAAEERKQGKTRSGSAADLFADIG